MKKITLLLIIIIAATLLIAAAPAQTAPTASTTISVGRAPMICFDQSRHKFVPCRVYTGEPGMEKVVSFNYPFFSTRFVRNSNLKFVGAQRIGCATFYLYVANYKTPIGCSFRYQY